MARGQDASEDAVNAAPQPSISEGHWHDHHFLAGIVSGSLAGIVLGIVLGLIAPHNAVPRFLRTLRILFRREHPRWELLTQ
jgi:hypothetical protein